MPGKSIFAPSGGLGSSSDFGFDKEIKKAKKKKGKGKGKKRGITAKKTIGGISFDIAGGSKGTGLKSPKGISNIYGDL